MRTVPHTNTFKQSNVKFVVNNSYTDLVDLFGYALYTLPTKYWDPYLSGTTKLSHFRNYGIVEPDCTISGSNGYMNLADEGMLYVNPKTITVQIKVTASCSVSLGWDTYGQIGSGIRLLHNGTDIGGLSVFCEIDDQGQGQPWNHPGWDSAEYTYTVTGLTYYDTLSWTSELQNGTSGQGQDAYSACSAEIVSITLTTGDTGTRIVPVYYGWSGYNSGNGNQIQVY